MPQSLILHCAFPVRPVVLSTVDGRGILRAGTKSGFFEDAVLVDVVRGTSKASATASLRVEPDPLEKLQVKPFVQVVEIGDTHQFQAIGTDVYGNSIPGLEIVWSGDGIDS